MNVNVGGVASGISNKWDGHVVRNPGQVTNAFTIKDEDKAAATLKLHSDEKISELKEALKKYDMTLVSTNELKEIGRLLRDNGLIDDGVTAMLFMGNHATDEDGVPSNLDFKFNAIAMFNEMLEDSRKSERENPESRLDLQEGHMNVVRDLIGTNQVVSALSYFSNSARSDLSVREQA